MIVYRRGVGEELTIAIAKNCICHVKIYEIKGDKVRLEIDVPDNIAVHRREVYDAIRRAMASELGEESLE